MIFECYLLFSSWNLKRGENLSLLKLTLKRLNNYRNLEKDIYIDLKSIINKNFNIIWILVKNKNKNISKISLKINKLLLIKIFKIIIN